MVVNVGNGSFVVLDVVVVDILDVTGAVGGFVVFSVFDSEFLILVIISDLSAYSFRVPLLIIRIS